MTVSDQAHPAQTAGAHNAVRSGPEDLDDVLRTTRPRGWWALGAISALVVIIVAWSLMATIPQQLTVPASISVDSLRTFVVSPASGQVSVKVRSGESVEADQELANIDPFDGSAAISVVAPSAGVVGSIEVADGQGVQPGTAITSVVRVPDADEGVVVTTFLPASQAALFASTEEVDVIVTDLPTARQISVPARVGNISVTPTDLDSIVAETGSRSFAESLAEQGRGVVFRVSIVLTPANDVAPSISIVPGEIVQIVNTYDNPRPIQLLFGGR